MFLTVYSLTWYSPTCPGLAVTNPEAACLFPICQPDPSCPEEIRADVI
jgi:hypothetical protein